MPKPAPSRIFDLFDHISEQFLLKKDVMVWDRGNGWEELGIEAYRQQSELAAAALLACGISRGDRVASMTNNRAEWNILDMGLASIGAIHVTIYPTLGPVELAHVLSHSGTQALFISDQALWEKIREIVQSFSQIRNLVSFDSVPGLMPWSEFLDLGSEPLANDPGLIKWHQDTIKPDDPLALIYTSGTTGVSKGVLLSHRNLLSTALCSSQRHVLKAGDRCVSILPLSHVFEHMVSYMHQYLGITIWYARSVNSFAADVKESQAQGFVAVPRLIEKIFDKMVEKGRELPFPKKHIFFWAVGLGFRFEFEGKNGWFYELNRYIADRLVFSKWRKVLGGNIRFIGCGGAALQPRLERLFWAAGLPVYVGYGLTETSPIISVNFGNHPHIRLETVGKILEICEVKINPDGEILTKGENLMLGYYQPGQPPDPYTNEEGWFHTGDIGTVTEGRYLKITDRKKEIFKTSGGKYIAPQIIENRLKESSFIEQAMVVGEGQKFAAALIVPNFPFLHDWCSRHKVKFHDNTDLIALPSVIERIGREIEGKNASLGQYERIRNFRLVAEDWNPVSGELSPTLKLRRKILEEKYKTEIKALFQKQSF